MVALRAVTCNGYITQEGEVMRCVGSRNIMIEFVPESICAIPHSRPHTISGIDLHEELSEAKEEENSVRQKSSLLDSAEPVPSGDHRCHGRRDASQRRDRSPKIVSRRHTP